jgi:hypothetical protein
MPSTRAVKGHATSDLEPNTREDRCQEEQRTERERMRVCLLLKNCLVLATKR